MDREPPTRKPHAAIGSSSSSSGEDSSSSAGDEDEAEQPPTADPSIPAVGPYSTSEEGTDDDEHEEAELPPTKNTSIPAPVGNFSTSEEETSSSSADEHKAEQRRTASHCILAPAGQGGDNFESDEDDDESELCGSSYVAPKRGPSPPLHLQGPPEPQTLPEGNASSPKFTKPSPMKRTAAAAKLAEASSSKKKAAADVPSKSPPLEKPAAAGQDHHTKPSSSSEEDSSSGDEREVEQRPTTATPILAPSLLAAGQEGDSPDGDDEEEEDDQGEPVESFNAAAKRGPSLLPRLQGVPETQTPPEGNVPSPKLTKPSPVKRTAAAAELAELSSSKKKKAPANVTSKSPLPEKPAAAGEDHHTKSLRMAAPTKEVTGLPEKAVAAKKAAKLLKKAVATKKVAEPRVAGKKVAKPPPPSKAAAAVARQAARKEVAYYNVEKHLQEKTETFWHLAETVNVLERKHKAPGLYKAAFLNIADSKAAVLDAKIKKQKMYECKLFIKRCDIEGEVIRTLSKFI